MEGLHHKMRQLQKDRQVLHAASDVMDKEIKDFNTNTETFEKDITAMEKTINQLENALDDSLTACQDASDKLILAGRKLTEAELENGNLERKQVLINDELKSIDERMKQIITSCTEKEQQHEDQRRAMKIGEVRANDVEEKLELAMSSCEEATRYAEEANRKFEDVSRKLNMVETEYERFVDKAESLESKNDCIEEEIRDLSAQQKELEELCVINAEKEENYENTVRLQSDKLKNSETQADFGERTVEKLDQQIDKLQDTLYHEKMTYKQISDKLDETLKDMLANENC